MLMRGRLLMASLRRLPAFESSHVVAATSQGYSNAQYTRLQYASTAATSAPETPEAPETVPVRGDPTNEIEKQRKISVNRLLYRARQRGFLELDLLVGMWAEKNIPLMSPAALESFSTVLDVENPDLFMWLTGQQASPEELRENTPFLELQAHVQQQIADHRSPSAKTPEGATWVRGWDDWKKGNFPQPMLDSETSTKE